MKIKGRLVWVHQVRITFILDSFVLDGFLPEHPFVFPLIFRIKRRKFTVILTTFTDEAIETVSLLFHFFPFPQLSRTLHTVSCPSLLSRESYFPEMLKPESMMACSKSWKEAAFSSYWIIASPVFKLNVHPEFPIPHLML